MEFEPRAAPAVAATLSLVSWDGITQPACYVEISTGDLYRVPQEAVEQRASPIIRKESLGASCLLRIHEDPFIATAQARMLAAACDVLPRF